MRYVEKHTWSRKEDMSEDLNGEKETSITLAAGADTTVDQELDAEIVTKQYKLTPKFVLWVKYFTDRESKETFGNQVQSAIKAYNLDPESQYMTGCTIGYQNVRKLKAVGSAYGVQRGITFGRMIDVAIQKMSENNSTGWWDRLMFLMGYTTPDEMQTGITNVNQNMVQVVGQLKDKYGFE